MPQAEGAVLAGRGTLLDNPFCVEPENSANLVLPVSGASGKCEAFPAWGRGTAKRWIGRLSVYMLGGKIRKYPSSQMAFNRVPNNGF